jgi:glutathione S-transferase
MRGNGVTYELYWISGSPYAWWVMLAMEFKGVSYNSRRLDPGKREHKTAEFIALNPRGKIPVLTDGDFVLSESIAILAYLEQKHPEPPLFGETPEETGLVWQRISEVMSYLRDSVEEGVIGPLFRGKAEQAGEAIKASAVDAHGALKWLEGVLMDAPYLAGRNISAADLSCLPILQRLARAGRRDDAAPLELGFDEIGAPYPNIATWLTKMEALPGYGDTYPPHWRNT